MVGHRRENEGVTGRVRGEEDANNWCAPRGDYRQRYATNDGFLSRHIRIRINPARPKDKLPYDGAWLWIGDEMIHIMELPNPIGRHRVSTTHGGRDRHF